MVTKPTPRSRRSRSGAGSGRRRQSSSQNNSAQMVAIAAGAGVVILVAVWALSQGGNDEPAEKPVASNPPAAKQAVADKEPPQALPAVKTRGKPGKTPDRPAPEIRETHLQRAEALYQEAKRLDIQARKAQKTGDHGSFNRLINDAWDKLEEVGPVLKPYDEWFELADLDDWAIPASYLRYQKRITKIDRLRGRIRRIRPMRRK